MSHWMRRWELKEGRLWRRWEAEDEYEEVEGVEERAVPSLTLSVGSGVTDLALVGAEIGSGAGLSVGDL